MATAVLFIVSCTNNSTRDKATDAIFVWFDEEGSGRHQFVYFAYEFSLEEDAKEAILNLFADSRYLLKVNGTNINWSPGRFYPSKLNAEQLGRYEQDLLLFHRVLNIKIWSHENQ